MAVIEQPAHFCGQSTIQVSLIEWMLLRSLNALTIRILRPSNNLLKQFKRHCHSTNSHEYF